MLSGEYRTLDFEALLRGAHNYAPAAPQGLWPQTLPQFVENYDQLAPQTIGLIRATSVHVAPLPGDGHLHDRVEGAIGRYYKTHSDTAVKDLFGPGQKIPAVIPFDKRLRLLLSSDASVAGIPVEIIE